MSHLEVIHKMAMSTSDKRTALMAAQYLVDRSLGKVSTKLDINTESKEDYITDDMLEAEFLEFGIDCK